jgi:hypothetical protein
MVVVESTILSFDWTEFFSVVAVVGVLVVVVIVVAVQMVRTLPRKETTAMMKTKTTVMIKLENAGMVSHHTLPVESDVGVPAWTTTVVALMIPVVVFDRGFFLAFGLLVCCR